MASGRLETTWRHLRSLLGAASAADTADAQLLAHYVAERDDAVFAELVRRHGPLVLGVCRRVLTNPHDVEDAFQATFLILSHKAASIRKGDSLASWLHHVALRAAVRLQRNVVRRKEQTLPADTPQVQRDDVSWREVQQLLDEELARLPDRFRRPLILCYLEGKTRDEAADELGWSLSTFRGRLERGRDRLRRRLERRGLTLSAALLATLAARHASAALPPTITASAQAAALATEVLRTMFLGKVKTTALWCLAVLFLSAGVGAMAYRCVAVEPAATKLPTATKPPTLPEVLRRQHEPAVNIHGELLEVDRAWFEQEIKPRLAKQPEGKRGRLMLDQEAMAAVRKTAVALKTNDTRIADGNNALYLSQQTAFTYQAAPKKTGRAYHGVTLGTGVRISADRRFIRMTLTQTVTELVEINTIQLAAKQGEEPLTVEAPNLHETKTTLTVEVDDGFWVLLPLASTQPGDTKKKTVLLAVVQPSISIGEEEREKARQTRMEDKPAKGRGLGHTEWIEKSLKEMQTVKVGSTREDLLKVFTTEGGLSTRTQRTYAYRECPYLKVDVEFKPVVDPEKKLLNHPKDEILKLSKPYLDWSIGD